MTTIPIVYVAGPFTGPTPAAVRENIRTAAMWGHRVRQLGAGVLVPHLLGAPYAEEALDPIADEFGYQWWIRETMEHMRRCDALLLVPGWEDSSGSRGERLEMLRLLRPVFVAATEWDKLKRWIGPRAGVAE